MIPELSVLMRVIVAIILGGLVGWEREHEGKPAGVRTHMLVAGASALLTGLGEFIIGMYGPEDAGIVMADPIRILNAIIVGVSFLVAGTIIQVEAKERVKHLTTAASILFVAAIGITAGLELYILAIGATTLALLINHTVGRFTRPRKGNA